MVQSKLHVVFSVIALITLGKAPLVSPLRNPDLEVAIRLEGARDPNVPRRLS
jgi:hypothetical protein